MKYQIELDVNAGEGVDGAGLSSAAVYIIQNALNQLPGVTSVVVTSVNSQPEEPVE